MNKALRPTVLPGGILLHGNKIWLAESTSMVLVILMLVATLTITTLIIWNESRIHHRNLSLAHLRVEGRVLEAELEQQREKARIVAILQKITAGKVALSTLGIVTQQVYENSAVYGYDPLLLLAVIREESVFNPRAQGAFRSGAYSGALGLMQLKLETAQSVAKKLGIMQPTVSDLMRPEINMVIGVAYLTSLIAQFKSFKLGILAYNQGPGTVRASLAGDSLSVGYYNRVLKSYYYLKQLTAVE